MKKGFTLVELLAVIAILAILIIIALPNVLKMFEKAKKDSFVTEAKSIIKSSEQELFMDSSKTSIVYGGNQVSSCPPPSKKMNMVGSKEVSYIINYDAAGNIVRFRVSNGKYYIEKTSVVPGSGVRIDQITTADLLEDIPDDFFSCTLYTAVENSFYQRIIDDNNPKSDSSIDFSYPSSSTNGRGLYYTSNNNYGEDGERIYYFRGSVNNNWVSLGGYLWRIVRTTSEGGVKLIYSGNGSGNSSGFIGGSSTFNDFYDDFYSVGYTYNQNSYGGVQNNSVVKDLVDNWYDNHLDSYNNYFSTTAVFCNDKSVARYTGWNYIFPPYDRLVFCLDDSLAYGSFARPTYVCSNNNKSRYTVSSSTGNGYLSRPIALLTADEAAYAGLVDHYCHESSLDSYINDNANNIDYGWWLMSPDIYGGVFSVKRGGGLGGELYAYYIRPTISLKYCVITTGGTGTKVNPYIVSDDSC